MATFQDRIVCWNDTLYRTQSTSSVKSIKYNYNPIFQWKPKYQTSIHVVNDDTIDSGLTLINYGYNPLILNFADDCFPGGCVELGSGAQEESIFRRTNYHMTLKINEFYPIKKNECVYSPNVSVIKMAEQQRWQLLPNPIFINLIACPGIKNPHLNYDENNHSSFNAEDEKIFIDKVRLICQTAYYHNHDSLVLGALSCGAWKGPVEHIAKLFKQVINEYHGMFKIVVFAIMCQPTHYINQNSTDSMNIYKIFTHILEEGS